MTTSNRQVRPRIQAVIDECLPLLKSLGKGRYAVTIGGSHGKGIFDDLADLDFRLFCDEVKGAPRHQETEEWRGFSRIVDHRRAEGIHIDYCWVRTVANIEAELDSWLNGTVSPETMVWTVWGYHLLTDIANQMILDDPHGLVAGWQARLTPYPRTLQKAIIEKHMGSLNYWRSDYHYRNKMLRRDLVFLAGITSRLVHDMMQVLFALNQIYFVGDGNNLHYVEKFAIQPTDFPTRVTTILYPTPTDDAVAQQYEAIIALIDDVADLVRQAQEGE